MKSDGFRLICKPKKRGEKILDIVLKKCLAAADFKPDTPSGDQPFGGRLSRLETKTGGMAAIHPAFRIDQRSSKEQFTEILTGLRSWSGRWASRQSGWQGG